MSWEAEPVLPAPVRVRTTHELLPSLEGGVCFSMIGAIPPDLMTVQLEVNSVFTSCDCPIVCYTCELEQAKMNMVELSNIAIPCVHY